MDHNHYERVKGSRQTTEQGEGRSKWRKNGLADRRVKLGKTCAAVSYGGFARGEPFDGAEPEAVVAFGDDDAAELDRHVFEGWSVLVVYQRARARRSAVSG
ncbi:hypothetical protein ACQP2T_13665 [Nonomuraea sp. CA-143628]|uniref:hypothetical protein n=1 Tax=Nonomuraea sp. CA-143628 TaxID=3239997 RepID=UPI003D8A6E03